MTVLTKVTKCRRFSCHVELNAKNCCREYVMAFVFLILFILAIIGIFRPYRFLPQGKRWHYGLAAFASFMAVGITAPETSQNPTSETLGKGSAAEVTAGTDQRSDKADEAPKAKWVYNTQSDEMRGSAAKFATLNSENTINFDFPYGEQPGILTVRRDPQYGLDVMFSIPSGQILCHGFGDSYINVKFDDGPIRKFNCNSASDGSSEVSFIVSPRQFLTSLKSAKRTVIEAEFYQAVPVA